MNIFDTAVLTRVVASLIGVQPFLLNSFFRTEQNETSEEIHFDVETGKRRVAPFVSPVVAGKVVESKGFTTSTFKPAYIKDKRVFDPGRPLKRAIGEQIGGALSPSERIQAMLAYELNDQVEMVLRRLELMAVSALRTGAITVSGDQYPTQNVNFGRDASLTVVLTGGNRWGQAGINPLNSLQDWALLVAKASGADARQVIMDVDAFKTFAADANVQKLLDRFRGQDALNPTVSGAGGRYMGSTGDFDIYVYADWYEDPTTGVVTPYLPSGTVILTGPDLEGVRAFGAIRDEEAGYQAMPYFPKSWVEKDPAVRYLLMQSAPLPVPYRINASLSATVL